MTEATNKEIECAEYLLMQRNNKKISKLVRLEKEKQLIKFMDILEMNWIVCRVKWELNVNFMD